MLLTHFYSSTRLEAILRQMIEAGGRSLEAGMMKRRSISKWAAAAAALLALLTTVNCGPASNSAEGTMPPSGPTNVIGGAGSTFVAPLMSAWISGYQQSHPKIGVNYRAIGSGGGLEEFKKGWVELAASDAPLNDDQLKELPATIQLPATAGPVCFVYNLPGLERPLRLSPSSVAGIFLGTIINWQDPALVRDNPGVKLPRTAVIVVHRSDGSGTTNILTEYLSKISQEWSSRAGHGLLVTWPVGLGADGSKGVLSLVKQSPGTIGFLELNYAKENGVPVAAVQNSAAEHSSIQHHNPPQRPSTHCKGGLAKDVRSPIVDPPPSAKRAYPVAGLTFLLLPKDRANKDEQVVIRDFIAYAISGGQDLAERLSYAKLPPTLQQQAQASLRQLTANGQPLN